MKRTRKWAFVAQEAKRLADLGLAPVEIAKRLGAGVNRSTVQRWMAAGKIRDTRIGGKGEKLPAFTKETTPDEWGKTVRKDYALDATDEKLVELAEWTLVVRQDPLQAMTTRLAAAREFRAIARQLALVARAADAPVQRAVPTDTAAMGRPLPQRRQAGDPRALLMAVK